MEIQVEKLPKSLRTTGMEQKLADVCRRNDVVFLAVFGSFVRGQEKKGVMWISQSSLISANIKLSWI